MKHPGFGPWEEAATSKLKDNRHIPVEGFRYRLLRKVKVFVLHEADTKRALQKSYIGLLGGNHPKSAMLVDSHPHQCHRKLKAAQVSFLVDT